MGESVSHVSASDWCPICEVVLSSDLLFLLQSWADVVIVSPQLFKETAFKLSLRDFSLRKVDVR